MSFVHLHCHSHYSLLAGASSPEELVARARYNGMTALALTDHNGLYGVVPFWQVARAAGIHPIIGAEVDLAGGDRIVLLAESAVGYRNLCRLVTALHVGDNQDVVARRSRSPLPLPLLREHSAGLIALSGGHSGLVSRLVRDGKAAQASKLIGEYSALFGAGRYYVELQAHADGDYDQVRRLAQLAHTLEAPVVATNDVLYAEPGAERAARIMLAIGDGGTLDGPQPDREPTAQRYLKSVAEMEAIFAGYPEALANTVYLARRCGGANAEPVLPLGAMRFPRVELTPGETAFSQLWQDCFAGLRARYRPLTPVAMDRLRYELEMIEQLGFAPYFLIVADIVRWARGQGIPVIGRGSAGDSLVAYVLGITQVDPLNLDLMFERFLNPERADPPDIDLDIDWRRRDDVLGYVYQRYGYASVAMIATHSTFRLNSAWRDVGKILGLAPEQIDSIGAALPRGHDVADLDSADAPPEWQAFRERELEVGAGHANAAKGLQEALRDCAAIVGRPRHLGIHCGGLVIAPGALVDEMPLERASKGLVITQFEMNAVAALGLVKMDLLGNRGLSTLHDTVAAVRQAGRDLHVETIPFDDAATYALLATGNTLGCFQLESPGLRALLQVLQPRSFDDIVAAVSLFRPGPLEGGFKNAYLARRCGAEQFEYLHPALERVLGETYGVILYQEQFLRLAHELAGLELGAAEQLRKALGQNPAAAERAAMQARFVAGAIRRDVAPELAAEIWSILERFSGFGFCKAHAASFGLVAYRTAYMKAHHPAELLGALLANAGGFYAPGAYIEEARRLGLSIAGPDINRSGLEFVGHGEQLSVGLGAVRGLSEQCGARIIAARRGGRFHSLHDFMLRVELAERELRGLIKVGAFDEIAGGKTRRQLLWQAVAWKAALDDVRKHFGPARQQAGLPQEAFVLPPAEQVPAVEEYNAVQRAQLEEHYLGFTLAARPLDFYDDALRQHKPVASVDLAAHVGRSVVLAGRVLTARRHITKTGRWLLFLSLEDNQGIIETILLPEVYRKYASEISRGGPYLVRGKVEAQRAGELEVVVEKVRSLRQVAASHRDQR